MEKIQSTQFLSIKEIRAKSAQQRLNSIDSTCKNWQAKAWLLERCDAQYFAPNAQELENIKAEMLEVKSLLTKVLSPQEIKNDDE